jgi:predicted dehydrogenase
VRVHERRLIRVGICGAGFIARAHSHGYAANPALAKVTRIVDHRLEHAERLAARHEAVASTDFADLLGSDVDVISLCTPTPTHAELAVAAMRAGKHILCEKPIATRLEDARAMIEACQVAGV